MPEQIVFDEDYFPREVRFWEQTSSRLLGFRQQFDAAEEIPSLSPHVSEWLNDLIPALNQAKSAISHNMDLGYQAAGAIADGLTEVGKRYGMAEDEAQEVARGVNKRV